MRIEYKTIHHIEGKSTWINTELLHTIPCCDKMNQHFKNNDDALFSFGFDSENRREVAVMFGEAGYYDSGMSQEYYSINYCPFCGEKIETQETVKINRVYENKTVPTVVQQTLRSYTDFKV